MLVHADLGERVVLHTHELPWTPSPAHGVQRRLLDRAGAEVGRATSIVAYAPGARFPAHQHPGGEEFLVLSGLFHDELGSYGPGTYVRNPPGSMHGPRAGSEGATLFVKLHQFAHGDVARVVVDTQCAAWLPGLVPGLSVLPLHEFDQEQAALVRWAPHTRFRPHVHWGGEEILVLDGMFCDEHGNYPRGSWLRSPHRSSHTPFTGPEGATIFVKVGHLGRPA